MKKKRELPREKKASHHTIVPFRPNTHFQQFATNPDERACEFLALADAECYPGPRKKTCQPTTTKTHTQTHARNYFCCYRKLWRLFDRWSHLYHRALLYTFWNSSGVQNNMNGLLGTSSSAKGLKVRSARKGQPPFVSIGALIWIVVSAIWARKARAQPWAYSSNHYKLFEPISVILLRPLRQHPTTITFKPAANSTLPAATSPVQWKTWLILACMCARKMWLLPIDRVLTVHNYRQPKQLFSIPPPPPPPSTPPFFFFLSFQGRYGHGQQRYEKAAYCCSPRLIVGRAKSKT